jgi:hypothetical protein
MVVVLKHTKIKKVTLEKKSTRGKIVSDILNRIMRYESGEMIDDNEVFALFQELVNTGLAWKLQGHYGRQAKALIEQGYVVEVDNNAES